MKKELRPRIRIRFRALGVLLGVLASSPPAFASTIGWIGQGWSLGDLQSTGYVGIDEANATVAGDTIAFQTPAHMFRGIKSNVSFPRSDMTVEIEMWFTGQFGWQSYPFSVHTPFGGFAYGNYVGWQVNSFTPPDGDMAATFVSHPPPTLNTHYTVKMQFEDSSGTMSISLREADGAYQILWSGPTTWGIPTSFFQRGEASGPVQKLLLEVSDPTGEVHYRLASLSPAADTRSLFASDGDSLSDFECQLGPGIVVVDEADGRPAPSINFNFSGSELIAPYTFPRLGPGQWLHGSIDVKAETASGYAHLNFGDSMLGSCAPSETYPLPLVVWQPSAAWMGSGYRDPSGLWHDDSLAMNLEIGAWHTFEWLLFPNASGGFEYALMVDGQTFRSGTGLTMPAADTPFGIEVGIGSLYEPTHEIKYDNVLLEVVEFPAPPAVVVSLVDSAGSGLPGGVVSYYLGGWKAFGVTGADGRTSLALPSAMYPIRIEYGGGVVQKSQNVGTDPIVVFQTTNVVVRLRDSAGSPLDTGTADYYAGSWRSFGVTSGGEVRRELLPTTYSFAMTYVGGRVQVTQNVALNPVVSFQTRLVSVRLMSSLGTPLDTGVADYYAGSWRTFGTTQGGDASRELLPTSYSFAMTYEGGRVQTTQDVSTNPTVVFQTRDVSVRLRSSTNLPLDGGTVEYYAGSWRPFGTTVGGEARKELLPTSYAFATTWAGGRTQLTQNVATSPGVSFQTGAVHSDSGTCTSYYASGWEPFSQDFELLPGTYPFTFSSGAPSQQSFTIAAGMENHIR